MFFQSVKAEGLILDKRETPKEETKIETPKENEKESEKEEKIIENTEDVTNYEEEPLDEPAFTGPIDGDGNPFNTLNDREEEGLDNPGEKKDKDKENKENEKENEEDEDLDYDEEFKKLLEGGSGDTGDVNPIPYEPFNPLNPFEPSDPFSPIEPKEPKDDGFTKFLKEITKNKGKEYIKFNVGGEEYNTGIYVKDENPDKISEALRQMSIFSGVPVYRDKNTFLILKDGETTIINVKPFKTLFEEYEKQENKNVFPTNDTLLKNIKLFETDNFKIYMGNNRQDGKYKMKDALSVFGKLPIKANGVIIKEDYANPIIEDGIVLHPVRTIGEALGCQVIWSDETFTATLKKGNIGLEFTPKKDEATLIHYNDNGSLQSRTLITLSATPKFENGRTMIPAKIAVDKFNGRIYYDESDNTLVINSEDYKEDSIKVGGKVKLTDYNIKREHENHSGDTKKVEDGEIINEEEITDKDLENLNTNKEEKKEKKEEPVREKKWYEKILSIFKKGD